MRNKKFLDLFKNLLIKLKRKIVLDTFLLLIIGALSSLSLPPFNFFLINFFTFSVFFIFLFKNLNHSNKKMFFFYGWLFGFSYFLTNIYWITISLTLDQTFKILIPIAFLLIPLFLAILAILLESVETIIKSKIFVLFDELWKKFINSFSVIFCICPDECLTLQYSLNNKNLSWVYFVLLIKKRSLLFFKFLLLLLDRKNFFIFILVEIHSLQLVQEGMYI